ncbi:beta-glucan synthesis-associated [Erysiphe pulchra]|uniref:Beta-glucan synthesis-associated n=1 Tax=Erysiphe pulchra TaxID=225359 RepID=A0A2S4PRH2_9PEZI|nr:beta-glucan synthesis-associated [Erysiphe pulchra]
MAYNQTHTRQPLHIKVNFTDRVDSREGDSPDYDPFTTQQSIVGQISRPSLYSPSTVDSSEMLLPPQRPRGPRSYRDSPIESPSRTFSHMSSRRGSFDSDGSRDSCRPSPFVSIFDDSRAPSRADSDDDNLNTQTVSEKYNIMPSAGLLLFPEDVEKDDWLHNPDPNDKDMDGCDIFTKRGMANVGGLVLICLGVLFLFIGYPVLTFVRSIIDPTSGACAADPNCLSDTLPLLKNQRTGLIDPDTPKSVYSKTSNDGKKLKLVFSDEFNVDGRTFYEGDDAYFEAVDIWYGVTQDLEWYDPDAVTTSGGTLNLKFDAFQNHNLNYRSGMVQSWNKLCFKGGRLEASISLPGRGDIQGFWPGFWAMGNLGRPGYPATTDGTWPYSYWDKCDAGITANQSQSDGLSHLPGMRLPACTCSHEDHPTPGKSRSSPEIDALEASSGFMGPGEYGGATGLASQSFQAAPFDIFYQPDYEYVEIYDHNITSMNNYRGGPYQEALSGVTWLNNEWYDGNAYQKYGFEYKPGPKGDISWFVGDEYTFKVDHRATRPNGNIGQRIIPEEPMALIINFGMSNSFATVFLHNLAQLMPATMRVDYIRIYQSEGDELTCDPAGFPTTGYIESHPEPCKSFTVRLQVETK